MTKNINSKLLKMYLIFFFLFLINLYFKIILKAQEILNEQLDDVKHMNKMMMYAKCVTVRDQQLDEKNGIHDHKKTEEKRKDLMMEIERLKKIKYYEELEKEKKELQKAGHTIIIDQIKERELKRLREKEEQEREGQQILKEIKQMQKEENENALVIFYLITNKKKKN